MTYRKFKEEVYFGGSEKDIINALYEEDSIEILKIKDESGNTPIHLAAEKGQLNLIKTYIDFIKSRGRHPNSR